MSFLAKICPPALLYLVVSLVVVLLYILQTADRFGIIFVNSVIYLLFVALWTWILNIICRAGYKWVSWVLVLLPIVLFILMFFFDLATVLYGRSGFQSHNL